MRIRKKWRRTKNSTFTDACFREMREQGTMWVAPYEKSEYSGSVRVIVGED
jgi:hypothetical protein